MTAAEGAAGGPLDLGVRTGLPDALKVLLAEYPRSGWTADANFNGLVSFWLDRHMMFRRLLDALDDTAKTYLDGGLAHDRFRSTLARYGGMLVNELHGHHQIEDAHYFPVLSARDPRIAEGFALLDRDHHALDGELAAFVGRANAALQAPEAASRDPAGAFLSGLDRLNALLDRHLEDEEDLVVPVILKHGGGGLG